MAEAVPWFDDGDSGLRGGDRGCPVAPPGHAALGPTTNFGFVKGNGPDVAGDGGIATQLGKGTRKYRDEGLPCHPLSPSAPGNSPWPCRCIQPGYLQQKDVISLLRACEVWVGVVVLHLEGLPAFLSPLECVGSQDDSQRLVAVK